MVLTSENQLAFVATTHLDAFFSHVDYLQVLRSFVLLRSPSKERTLHENTVVRKKSIIFSFASACFRYCVPLSAYVSVGDGMIR